MQSPIQSYLENLHGRLAGMSAGEVATYIPELSKANPDWFGICLVTMDGEVYCVGDAAQLFTIQSISKPFVYAKALADRGWRYVTSKVGVEPSGDAFNSISLDPLTGAPLNPMINAGAIATASLIEGADPAAQWQHIAAAMEDFIGHPITVDEAVYRSESETGYRNRAIAWMLKNFGIIDGDPMASLENYFRQCAILVNCQDIAFMAATLANGGVHPLTGRRAVPAEYVERVLSVMTTCGMYDYAGSWLYEVGMPAKSGVGGGILAVLPGRFGIGIFSPPLDAKGNSVRGIETCKRFSQDFHLHIFSHTSKPAMALARVYTGAEAFSRRKLVQEKRDYLMKHVHRIQYLCLQGFLAVDNVEYVIRRMADLADESDSFILDMNQVEAVSESAAVLLNQARVNLCAIGIAVVFSRLRNRKAIMDPLSKPVVDGDTGFLSFEDNDLAAEWCENRLLGDMVMRAEGQASLSDFALFKGVPAALVDKVEAITSVHTFAKGKQILATGEPVDGRIFFILSGHVSILVPLADGSHQRIASLSSGMHFGEMALLGQTTRSASVYVDTDLVCRVLHVVEFNKLASALPQLKISLLENVSNELAEMLRRATGWIAALA